MPEGTWGHRGVGADLGPGVQNRCPASSLEEPQSQWPGTSTRPEDGESGQASLPAPAASTLEKKTEHRRKLVGSGPRTEGYAFPSDRLAVPGPVGPHLVASL